MDDQIFYKFKRSVHYIGSQKHAALFYFFGKKIIVKGPFIHSGFDKLMQAFKCGISHASLSAQLLEIKIDPVILPLITREFEQKGMLTIKKFLYKTPEVQIFGTINNTPELSDYLVDSSELNNTPKNILFFSLLGSNYISAIEHVFMFKNALKGDGGQLIKTQIYNCDPEEPLATPANLSAADLCVVLSNGFQSSAVHKLNTHFYKNKKPWLFATVDGYGGTVGPYFSERAMPCYNCYTSRRLANETDSDTQILLENYFSTAGSEFTVSDLIFMPILQLIQLEVYKILFMPIAARSVNGLTDFDLINFSTKQHTLLPVPSCEVCSPLMRENIGDQNYIHRLGLNKHVQL